MQLPCSTTHFHLFLSTLFAILLIEGAHAARASQDPADEAMLAIRAEAIRAEMRFLADDLLEGRAAGTRGHEIAARFVASEFESMGLEPAGENGTYFQSVRLRSILPDREHTSLAILQGGREHALIFGQDFIGIVDPARADTALQAPVVYAGFGVTAPEQGYDDYAGIDAKRKIVALLPGAPARLESTVRAHYSSSEQKTANAAAHGAVGVLLLNSPDREQSYPFKDRVSDLAFPSMCWLDAQNRPNNYFPELRVEAALSMEATRRVIEGGGKPLEEIYAAAARMEQPSSLALPVTARIRIASKFTDLSSPNVVARLRGSDPQLQHEYVVYSAHLDHLGMGEPVNGDKIYNGAMDNASGSATLLEIARAYSQMKPRPRRSILFVSVTAEEEGLLGSDYFAHYPTVTKSSLVADINIDGSALLWPVEDVIARGSEHSTLASAVREAAERMNLGVSPDPSPELVLFIRSDQYSFVKQGIPSLFLSPGRKSSNPKIKPEEIITRWRRNIYHKPQDDMSQPFDFASGAIYAKFAFVLGYLVAQKTEKPEWNPHDFFAERYGQKVN